MSSRRIHIDRLDIRVKGAPRESARAAVENIGQAVLSELSAPPVRPGGGQRIVGRVDAGTSAITPGGGPARLRSAIAAKVAAAITSKLG